MKKVIIFLLISLFVAKLKAQTFTKYADTANYLIHEIGNKKSLFLGKPMSVLLDSLKIQVVKVYSSNGTAKDDTFGASMFLEFNYERKFEKAHFITVDFNTPPPYSQSFPLFFPPTGGKGAIGDILAVYRLLTIKGITVKDYTDDDPVNPDVHY